MSVVHTEGDARSEGRWGRCDGLSVGKVCEIRNGKVPGGDWSTTGREVCSGHLSRFERCCGAARNPLEILRKAFLTAQKSLGWELATLENKRRSGQGSHSTSFHHPSTHSINGQWAGHERNPKSKGTSKPKHPLSRLRARPAPRQVSPC